MNKDMKQLIEHVKDIEARFHDMSHRVKDIESMLSRVHSRIEEIDLTLANLHNQYEPKWNVNGYYINDQYMFNMESLVTAVQQIERHGKENTTTARNIEADVIIMRDCIDEIEEKLANLTNNKTIIIRGGNNE